MGRGGSIHSRGKQCIGDFTAVVPQLSRSCVTTAETPWKEGQFVTFRGGGFGLYVTGAASEAPSAIEAERTQLLRTVSHLPAPGYCHDALASAPLPAPPL